VARARITPHPPPGTQFLIFYKSISLYSRYKGNAARFSQQHAHRIYKLVYFCRMDIAQLICTDTPRPSDPNSPHVTSSSIVIPYPLPSPTSDPRRVVCQLCGKSFSGVSSHNRHVSRTHHKARPFLCVQCPQSFGQKGSLERHIAGVHRKERPFSCVHCSKNFGRSDNLRIHISTVHLKQRPHKCTVCQKSFGGKRPLKIHQQTVHLKQRPLECQLCARRFGQRSNLNAHLRHVHKQEPMLRSSKSPFKLPTSPASSTEGLQMFASGTRFENPQMESVPESALQLMSRQEPTIPGLSTWNSPRLS